MSVSISKGGREREREKIVIIQKWWKSGASLVFNTQRVIVKIIANIVQSEQQTLIQIIINLVLLHSNLNTCIAYIL